MAGTAMRTVSCLIPLCTVRLVTLRDAQLWMLRASVDTSNGRQQQFPISRGPVVPLKRVQVAAVSDAVGSEPTRRRVHARRSPRTACGRRARRRAAPAWGVATAALDAAGAPS